jgi:N6-L-threonylcarbamoyladenine synthase
LKADLLARYGGVAPKMAEEAHALVIDQVWFLRSTEVLQPIEALVFMYLICAQVVQKALDDAKLSGSDLSAVAVTVGPGLSLCLRGMDVPPLR